MHSNALIRYEVEWKVVAFAKLYMDFGADTGLVGAMAEYDDTDETKELVRQLFYLLTIWCEDGAELAVQGQADASGHEFNADLADKLHILGQQIAIVADAVRNIVRFR